MHVVFLLASRGPDYQEMGKIVRYLIGNPALVHLEPAHRRILPRLGRFLPAVFGRLSVHRIITTYSRPTRWIVKRRRGGGGNKEKEGWEGILD